MNTCNFCSKPATCAGKEYSDSALLGSASHVDEPDHQPIEIVYGCEDHADDVYKRVQTFVNKIAAKLETL